MRLHIFFNWPILGLEIFVESVEKIVEKINNFWKYINGAVVNGWIPTSCIEVVVHFYRNSDEEKESKNMKNDVLDFQLLCIVWWSKS